MEFGCCCRHSLMFVLMLTSAFLLLVLLLMIRVIRKSRWLMLLASTIWWLMHKSATLRVLPIRVITPNHDFRAFLAWHNPFTIVLFSTSLSFLSNYSLKVICVLPLSTLMVRTIRMLLFKFLLTVIVIMRCRHHRYISPVYISSRSLTILVLISLNDLFNLLQIIID